ncbi:MAG: orotate phosphoribosyltransferase [Methanomicrobia archaeon]|nr:orotate phosphoribosyltransferase [Methanomicrobia archaeon]
MEMKEYKKNFIEFLLKKNALKIGEFKLKSGRISPYFINTGMFDDGESIGKLGYFYAAKIVDRFKDNFDIIFGPAYKGIPLSVATAISLNRDFGMNRGYCFNRKEIKKHGEKKAIVGHKIESGSKILMIDDVFTTGGTKYDSIDLLNSIADNLEFVGLVIAVDRKEVDKNGKNAIKEFEMKTGIPVDSIVNINEIIRYLRENRKITEEEREIFERYLRKYGVE